MKGTLMASEERLNIAVQKSGRLSEKSLALLSRCGLDIEPAKDKLFWGCKNFPLDVMQLRDDDIPEYVRDGVCDLGIVGRNVLEEKLGEKTGVEIVKRLGFGVCRLALALPTDRPYEGSGSLVGMRIATSYPRTLRRFLDKEGIGAEVVEISGSVELAPALKIAEAICDLVSTGSTLRSNGLREVCTVMESESVIVRTGRTLSESKQRTLERLEARLAGVMRADRTKYIMMNAPRTALAQIKRLLPGMEAPTVMPLSGDRDRIAIHAVAHENVFWETMEGLKAAGATSILVVPIEKIL